MDTAVPTTPDDRARANALVIATRASPLALAQAELVKAALTSANPGLDVSLARVKTSGDRFTDRPLSEIGGKGLFTKEIEEALLDGRADIAVHSMKDVATELPGGLIIPSIMEREDPRDVLIARDPSVKRIGGLPDGARIGTASLRRAAQARSIRPDIEIVLLRGNVATRLEKIRQGHAEATFLALAGLNRLGVDGVGTVLEPDDMLPAVGQGAIGIQCREDDARVRALLAPLDHAGTHACVRAERALLAALDGSCRTPIAALATLGDDKLSLRAMVAAPDGSRRFDAARDGAADDAAALGADAGRELRGRAGDAFLDAIVKST